LFQTSTDNSPHHSTQQLTASNTGDNITYHSVLNLIAQTSLDTHTTVLNKMLDKIHIQMISTLQRSQWQTTVRYTLLFPIQSERRNCYVSIYHNCSKL